MSNVQEGAKAQEIKEVLTVTVSGVKDLLKQGLDRKQIAAHYGKSVAEMAREVWSNPKLKNLKKKAEPSIVLVDDEDEAEGETVAVAVEEEVLETPTDNATQEVGYASESAILTPDWK